MATTVVRSPGAVGVHVAQRAARLSSELQSGPTKAVNAAAFTVKSSVAGFLGGNSITLSGVGKKGAKIGVRYTIRGTRNPTALVFATGPFHLIERDTKPHVIIGYSIGRLGKGKGSRSKAARHAAKQDLYNALFGGQGGRMQIGGDEWRTGPFNHPGSTGKHPFERGVNAARPNVQRIYRSMVNESIRKSFGSPL
jgi:hypothetical protein